MISTRPVDEKSWDDLTVVLGPNGASAGCWCTFWRLTNQEAAGKTPDDNRAVLEAAVRSGDPAGLLAYDGDTPVGWCSVAPRTTYKRIFRTKGLIPPADETDDPAVWSVVCVFVRKGHRGAGVARALLDAAVDFAREQGARAIEGYPLATPSGTKKTTMSSGTVELFAKAGFDVHARPSDGRRVIMRRSIP